MCLIPPPVIDMKPHLGRCVNYLIKKDNLTQAQLAKQVGCSTRTLRRWLAAARKEEQ